MSGFGMGIVPQQVGHALMQPQGFPQPERINVAAPQEIAGPEEHSPTATKTAVGEALTRLGNGVRRGENQEPKNSFQLDQLRRAGMSPVEIKILLASGGE